MKPPYPLFPWIYKLFKGSSTVSCRSKPLEMGSIGVFRPLGYQDDHVLSVVLLVRQRGRG